MDFEHDCLAQKHQIRSDDLQEGQEFDKGQFGAINPRTACFLAGSAHCLAMGALLPPPPPRPLPPPRTSGGYWPAGKLPPPLLPTTGGEPYPAPDQEARRVTKRADAAARLMVADAGMPAGDAIDDSLSEKVRGALEPRSPGGGDEPHILQIRGSQPEICPCPI